MTGASRGVGRAVAVAFAASGDQVAVHHRDSPALAAGTLAALAGDGHTVVQGDLADPAAVRSFVEAAAAALGGLDVLVNNAAVFAPRHPPAEVSYEQWQQAWTPHRRGQPARHRQRHLLRAAAPAGEPAAGGS